MADSYPESVDSLPTLNKVVCHHSRSSSFPVGVLHTPNTSNESANFSYTNSPQQVEMLEIGSTAETASNHTNGDDERTSAFFKELLKHGGIYIPFILLFFAKILADHSHGLLIMLGMITAFVSTNRMIKEFVLQKDVKLFDIMRMFWVIGLLSCSIFGMYYVFSGQQLYKSLYAGVPNLEKIDSMSLLWAVIVTDFIIRYISMIFKCFIGLLPKSCLSQRKKGSVFLLTEKCFQFYRCVPPTTLWVLFFTEGNTSYSWYNAILVILYVIVKAFYMWQTFQMLWISVRDCYAEYDIGRTIQTNNICAICHDTMSAPFQLRQCQHAFCQECIEIWLNREPTCPMCRCEVVKTTREWRDGSTSCMLQFF